MLTHDEALRHSPALWFVASVGACAALIVGGTIVWNVWDHRADIGRWLKL
jgi:hypothetical protein